MSIRSRARPWSLIAGALLVTAALFALGIIAVKADRDATTNIVLVLVIGSLAALLVPARRAAAAAREGARELALQRELEERFQPIFEHHPEPMWVHDLATFEFLAVNEAMINRYGYSEAELLGMGVLDIHPGDDREAIEAIIRGDAPPRPSWVHCTKAGEPLEVEVHTRTMRFGGRDARMVLGIDVTQRNRIVNALAESEQRHRTVVEIAQEGIIAYDLKGFVQLMNASMGEILGVDPEEQIGRSLDAGGGEPMDFSATPAIQDLVRASQEMVLTRGDGEQRTLLASSAPWTDADDVMKGTIVMCTDITERKRSEEQIRDSDALKTTMLDSSLDGIYTINAKGRILEFNLVAEKIFRVPREEAIGRSAFELLVPAEFRSEAEKQFGSVIEGAASGIPVAHRLNAWRVDGTEFPAELTIARTTGGEAHATFHIRDVTERDLHERTLKARARQQAAVAELGAFSLQAESMDEVYAAAASAIERGLAIEHVHVVGFNGDEIETHISRGWDEFPPPEDTTTTFHRLDDQLTDGPVIEDTRTTGSPAVEALVAAGIESGIFVGVIVDGEVCGVIGAHSTTRNAFGSDEQYFMKAIANVVSAALARSEDQALMSDLALRDSLTGLPNRAVFEQRLGEWATTAAMPAVVAFVDVDHFKVLNDALGHQAGDELLCALAPRFAAALGDDVLVARFGGDDFVVLVEDVEDDAVARVLAEGLLDSLTAPVEIDGRLHHVSVSIGVRLVRPESEDLLSAVRDADSAMYQAKERGRDCVEVFDESLHQRVVDRLRISGDLREALERDDQLWCAYQPLISGETGAVVGLEALARWKHPELGQLLPVEFIPAAEELGLISTLGWHILDQAVRDTADWAARGGALAAAAFVSVNLSPRQLSDPTLAPRISVLLDDVGLSPDRLTLEVTETSLLADTESALRGLEDLAALGVRLVLDDFGTGFSSMAYLSRMPVSGIKIDRSFISELGESARSQAIVKAMVSMAQALDLKVVAEGVETAAQAQASVEIGCDVLQGYLFSRPVGAAEVPGLAESSRGSLAA